MDKSTMGLCIFVLFWIVGGILYYYASQDFHIEQVDCFDKYDNKMNELTCDKKITNLSPLKIAYPICFVISFIVVGYTFYLIFKGE